LKKRLKGTFQHNVDSKFYDPQIEQEVSEAIVEEVSGETEHKY
jgi:hypothetical protein